MAKKRTLVPFYGKINQSLDERARRLTAAGDHEGAKALFKQSRTLHVLRRVRAVEKWL